MALSCLNESASIMLLTIAYVMGSVKFFQGVASMRLFGMRGRWGAPFAREMGVLRGPGPASSLAVRRCKCPGGDTCA